MSRRVAIAILAVAAVRTAYALEDAGDTARMNGLADRFAAAVERRTILPDLSARATEAWLRRLGRFEAERVRLAEGRLSPAARLTAHVLAVDLARERAYLAEGWVTEDVSGDDSPPFAVIEAVLARQRRTASDWRRTLATLRRARPWFEAYRELLEQGMARGRVADRAAVRSAVERLKLLGARRASNPFLALGRELDAQVEASPPHLRPILGALAAELDATLARDVLPAHRDLARFLESRYLPRAEPSLGRRRDRYLHHLARHLGAGHPSPEALGRWGRRDVERLSAELRRLVHELDPGAPSVTAFMRRLRGDPTNRYRTGAELVTAAEKELGRAARLARSLAPVPRAPVAIAAVPRHAETTTAAQYLLVDGRRPRFELQLNTGPLLSEQMRHELANLVSHEVYGGHHLAQVHAERQRALPRFRRRRLDSAFDEGWAFYAETWRDEQGGFVGRERVGYLTDQLWRAARLVVDTGLHTGRMSRKDATRYFREATFSTQATARAEIQRYIDSPAQALAYAYGKRRLLATRAAVQEILGARFDARRFHARVLALGAVPPSEVHRALVSWAKRRAAR